MYLFLGWTIITLFRIYFKPRSEMDFIMEDYIIVSFLMLITLLPLSLL